MPRLLNVLPLFAALVFGAALHAQETTTPDTEEPAQAAPEAAPEAETTETGTTGAEAGATETDTEADAAEVDGLDMGTEVVDDPTYIKETYGDWQLKCFRSEGQEDLCQMYQLLREDAGNPVAEFSLFKLPEGSQATAGATIVVPLGTLLTRELLVSIDGGQSKSFSYSFCSAVGCFARIGLTAADVDAFQARRCCQPADRTSAGARSEGQHQGIAHRLYRRLRQRLDGSELIVETPICRP